MNASKFFIERPVSTAVLTAVLLFFGWFAFQTMPVNDLPAVDFPTISVTAVLPGADPETMATTVATPLERQFSTIAGLDTLSSVNTSGSTRITLQFELERNIDAAAQDVQTAIAQVLRRLPPNIDPPTMRKVNPADQPVLFVALSGKRLPVTALHEYADTSVAQRWSMIPGVAQVLIFGSQKYAARLFVDPNALAKRNLGLDQVVNAVQNANSSLPSGTLDGAVRSYSVIANGRLEKVSDFNSLVVAYRDGAPVRFADIGRAIDGVENDKVKSWYNNDPAIILAVQRQPGSNTVEVVRRIRELLPEMQAQLPAGAEMKVLFDRSDFIRASVHEVNFTLVLAILLVIGVILVFLRNVRSTLITALVLPTSVVGTFAAMHLLGFSLNNLSLMAITLAVGFVVDDAIVVLENITRHMEMGKPRRAAALDGAREIAFTIVSMTLSLAAVFIPILFMQGMLGRLFREFAVTVGVAVLISGAISLSLTPMLCSRYLRHANSHGRTYVVFERLFDAMRNGYGTSLRWSMRHRGLMLLASALILVATVWLYLLVPKGFVPRQDTGFLQGSMRAPEGTTFPEVVKRINEVAEIARKNPNVAATMVSAGQGGGGIYGANLGQIRLVLKPDRDASADEVIQQIRASLRDYQGLRLFLQTPPAINIGGIISNSEYQFILLGPELQKLYGPTDALEARLKSLPFVQDVSSNLELRNPEIQVNILRDRAASFGVTPQQIQSTLYNAFGGRQVSTLYLPSNQYMVNLEIDKRFQTDVNALNSLYTQSAGGMLVPLTSVAQIRSGVGPLSVNHFGQLPSTTISFNIAPQTSVGDAVAAVEDIAREMLPVGVTTTFAGTAQFFKDSLTTLPLLLGITILVIYAILAILYEHFGHPLTILTALPVAGFGALAMLFAFNQELNIFSFVGIILLVGLVKKNGIMMVDFALSLQRAKGVPPEEAIVEASLVRFRPIMMTTMAAILATLPLAFASGAGAEMRRALGIPVLGGLLFSQLLTLYLTPTFYVSLERLSELFKRIRTTSARLRNPS